MQGNYYMLPMVFGLSIIIMFLIYWVAGKTSTKSSSENGYGKRAPYACGEDMPAEELKVNSERFFVFTVYFLIFDVLAFILATSYYTIGLVPIAYSLIALISVAMLLIFRRPTKR